MLEEAEGHGTPPRTLASTTIFSQLCVREESVVGVLRFPLRGEDRDGACVCDYGVQREATLHIERATDAKTQSQESH